MAFTLGGDDQGDVIVNANPGIEQLIPAPGSEVLRQEQVGVDLAAGYSAELEINGVPIPPDEVNVLRSDIEPSESNATTGTFGTTLNRFVYQPLEGRAVPELKADENCVVATFWPLADPTDISEVRLVLYGRIALPQGSSPVASRCSKPA